MPALYAHLRFGEEVAKLLPTPYKQLIQAYPEAFALGTQGPDVLFYHKPLKTNEIKARGTLLHTWSGEKFFLAQGAKLLANTPDGNAEDILTTNGALAAYTCGFLCHFTLDTNCHPYIDAHSTQAVTHGKIESEFDKHVLRLNNMPTRGYNVSTPIADRNGVKEAVAKTVEVDESAVALCIETMHKINGMFSKKCEFFHIVIHAILKIIKMDKKFGDMFLHKKDDPLCVETNAELMKRFNGAVLQAAMIIPQYFENLRTSVENQTIQHELFRYDFSGILKTEE